MGTEVTFGEANDLVLELGREIGSHLTADTHGWKFAADYGELLAGGHYEAFMNANRDEKKHPEPFQVLRPWPSTVGHGLSEAEVEEYEIQLMERSAFQ